MPVSGKIYPNTHSQEAIARMRQLREAKGLSAQKLATRMTVQGHPLSRTTIANMENGHSRSMMTVDELFAFARALCVSPEVIIGTAPLCSACQGDPPAGFQCLACGSKASA